METELLELLKKSLPSMQVDVLINQLEEGKEAKALSGKLSEQLKVEKANTENLRSIVNEQRKLDDERLQIEAREKKCDKREQQFEIELLKEQLKSKQTETNNMFALVSLLVKNPRAIELINGMESQVITTSYPGGNSSQHTQNSPFSSTAEKKETKDDFNV